MMIKEQSGAEDVGGGLEFASMMREYWKKEIEEAIEEVKGDIRRRKPKGCRGLYGRGYWTPAGFAWFRRRRKWCNYKR
jgi:hypothetical protein